jgi:hypothetical protein
VVSGQLFSPGLSDAFSYLYCCPWCFLSISTAAQGRGGGRGGASAAQEDEDFLDDDEEVRCLSPHLCYICSVIARQFRFLLKLE